MNKEEILKAFDLFYAQYNISFNARFHRYSLDGVSCAGVSTVSEYRSSPFLVPWAAKMVVEHLKDKQDIIKTATPEEYEALLLEAKKMHKTKSEEAMEIGTRVHQFCQDWIEGKNPVAEEDIKNPTSEFLKFEKEHKVEWVATEKIVCSPAHLVAGRLDSIAFVDGILSLVDLKTSSSVRESYYLQTAGYAMCLAEMGIPVDRRIILRLPKIAGDSFEAVEVDTELFDDIEGFLGQRRAYGWANMISVRFSDDVKVGKYKQKQLRIKKI